MYRFILFKLILYKLIFNNLVLIKFLVGFRFVIFVKFNKFFVFVLIIFLFIILNLEKLYLVVVVDNIKFCNFFEDLFCNEWEVNLELKFCDCN